MALFFCRRKAQEILGPKKKTLVGAIHRFKKTSCTSSNYCKIEVFQIESKSQQQNNLNILSSFVTFVHQHIENWHTKIFSGVWIKDNVF